MCDPALWALMQRVERLRFRAELLERASIDQPRGVRKNLLRLAAHSREMAELAYAEGLAATAAADNCQVCATAPPEQPAAAAVTEPPVLADAES